MPTFILLFSFALCISAPIYLACYRAYGYNKSLPSLVLAASLIASAWQGYYRFWSVVGFMVPMGVFSAFGAYFFSVTKQGVNEIDYALTFVTLLLMEPVCLIAATSIPPGEAYVNYIGYDLISFFAPNGVAFLLWCWQKHTGRLPVEV